MRGTKDWVGRGRGELIIVFLFLSSLMINLIFIIKLIITFYYEIKGVLFIKYKFFFLIQNCDLLINNGYDEYLNLTLFFSSRLQV